MNVRSTYTASMSPAAVAAAGLAALAAGMGIGRFAFTPILPLMQAEGTLTLAGGGWLAAANYAGYLAGALSAPLVPARRAVRAGLSGIALFTLAMALEHRLASWIALRAAAGVASAWVLIHVSAWSLARLASLSRPALSGVVYSGVGAGAALAGAVCLAVLHLRLGADHAWIALGLVALVVALASWPVFAGETGPAARKGSFTWDRASVVLVACYGAFGFGYIIPATFIPAFARETLGDAALYGWAWPVFGAAAAVSTVAAAPLSRRFGARAVWIGGHLVMAAGVAAPLFVHGMAGIVACALCVGATFVVITMAGLQEASKLGGANVLAAMTAGFAAGQIAGPAFVSLLVHAGGSPALASVAACALLIVAAAALALWRSEQ
ncbi:MAG TPA: YbfB/YjiJ family MFS transporter [Burkholderiales bacterium]